MAVTITDVAKRADVGIGTVSRVVNGGTNVSISTRNRVEAVMRELGYHPNTHARNLKRQSVATIGFLFMSGQRQMSDPFFSTLMAGLADAAGEMNHDLHVASCPHAEHELATLDRLIRGNHVGGIVLTDTRLEDPRVGLLQERAFPYVAFGRVSAEAEPNALPTVDIDGHAGVQQAMRHLIAQGHRRIGFITLPVQLMCTQDRLNGYLSALQAADLPLHEALVISGGLSEDEGRRAAEQLMALSSPPTAIVCCSDVLAFGAARAIEEHGLSVGQDVALVGFDDVSLAAHASPPLTTVRQPIYEIGREIVHMLVQRMRGAITTSKLIEPTLIIRQSTTQWKPTPLL